MYKFVRILHVFSPLSLKKGATKLTMMFMQDNKMTQEKPNDGIETVIRKYVAEKVLTRIVLPGKCSPKISCEGKEGSSEKGSWKSDRWLLVVNDQNFRQIWDAHCLLLLKVVVVSSGCCWWLVLLLVVLGGDIRCC